VVKAQTEVGFPRRPFLVTPQGVSTNLRAMLVGGCMLVLVLTLAL
jgi:hypothetical protein